MADCAVPEQPDHEIVRSPAMLHSTLSPTLPCDCYEEQIFGNVRLLIPILACASSWNSDELEADSGCTASIGREPARTGEVTGLARDVSSRQVYPSEFEKFEHELYRWTYITRERKEENRMGKNDRL
jgi:hypothetical protein